MYVLDTNVISELRRGKPDSSDKVRLWASRIPANQMFVSAISVLELERGVQALERKTPPQGSALRVWLTGVRALFSARMLPFNERTATLCAALHLPHPRPGRDAMIAATALEHRMGLVTRNVADFQGCGLALCNPWDIAG